MKRIDPHVHCRDGKQAYKTNVREVSELAEAQGIVHMCDMPNTDPPILREKDVIARLRLVYKRRPVVGYSLYVGLTVEEEQIKEAVKLVAKYPEVAGLKLYSPEKKIYRQLAKLGYSGVLAVHAEKASLFKPELFNPRRPWTHNLAQPPEAEIASVEEQIKFAEQADFQGALYICHITLPESARLIWQAKKCLNIYSEVTPHHLLLHEGLMMEGSSLLLKVNPPLRSSQSAKELLKAVKQGMIDCIGTDFAPHLLKEKLFPPHLSGIASYELYGQVLDFLRQEGVSEEEIEKLTFDNIKKVFGEKLSGV